ncbi:hypothetical protein GVN20_26545 [Runella sp. CRIBMP]|uniref:DUF5672 family protein n=1 Tax=Runella sp. CRIBMP TaxID=2683261 RepID=UPI001412912C|nr:DUF5672 family protein [Runella sp. CRIBMP]NBB22944.1 hypothetical protein [Runella sp. CRIBMP]
MKHKVAVVIPIYRLMPNELELKSLNQCLNVLKSYPIIFFCANSFDSSNYENIVKSYSITFEKKCFDDKYFKDKKGYNSLCLNKYFYQSFDSFDFMLIYQLDAWVFRDELNYWCSLGYDYIGAPFPEDFDAKQNEVVFSVVGNGGFSLRKISTIVNILSGNKRLKNWQQLISPKSKRAKMNPLLYPYLFIRYLGYRNTINHLKKDIWEDHFFSEVYKLTSYINIAPPELALAFSFEYRPSAAFEINNQLLPFGCHAWHWIEYDEFWRKFI